MSSFGFEFETIEGRKFRLDEIQPFLLWGITFLKIGDNSDSISRVCWCSKLNCSTGLQLSRDNLDLKLQRI